MYSFGLRVDAPHFLTNAEPRADFLYNGKENIEELDFNMLEYGFRLYDPAIGRFPSVDPIADNFAWVSGFNYAENDPVQYIDLWGLQQAQPGEALDFESQFWCDYQINDLGVSDEDLADLTLDGVVEWYKFWGEIALWEAGGNLLGNALGRIGAKLFGKSAKGTAKVLDDVARTGDDIIKQADNNVDVAKSFMRENGVAESKIEQHLQAIHPNGEVTVQTLNSGDIVYRYEFSGQTKELIELARKHGINNAEYFFLETPAPAPIDFGLFSSGRVLESYRVIKSTEVLKSTTNLSGDKGAVQIFSPHLFKNIEKIK